MRRLVLLVILAGCSADATAPDPVTLTGIYDGRFTTPDNTVSLQRATIIMTETAPSHVEGTIALPSGTMPIPFTGVYGRDTLTVQLVIPPPYGGGATGRFAVSDAGAHLVGPVVGTDGGLGGGTFNIDVHRAD